MSERDLKRFEVLSEILAAGRWLPQRPSSRSANDRRTGCWGGTMISVSQFVHRSQQDGTFG